MGEKEEADGTVSVRMQGEGDKGTMKLEEFAAYLADLVKKRGGSVDWNVFCMNIPIDN